MDLWKFRPVEKVCSHHGEAACVECGGDRMSNRVNLHRKVEHIDQDCHSHGKSGISGKVMTYISLDQLTSHEAEGRVGCEFVLTDICHIPPPLWYK